MNEKYEVYEGSIKIASYMDLDIALCLIKGYFNTYPNDAIKMTIKKMNACNNNEPGC